MKKMKLLKMSISTLVSVILLAGFGDSAMAAGSSAANARWTIDINDVAVFQVGPTKLNMAMKMTASTPSGGIGGEYRATAKARMDTMTVISEGWAESDAGATSAPFTFTVRPAIPLAPLVPADRQHPAPPVPGPDWEADGEITMSTSGAIDVHADGDYTGGLSDTSTLPFHMTITGRKVVVTINFPDLGTGNFRGTIRAGK